MKKFLIYTFFIFMPFKLFAYLENSPELGDKVLDFTLPNAYGNDINLYQELEKGPVILSFYRGGWCPVCNLQLHKFQKYLPEFNKYGAQLIAVSPETPTNSEVTVLKNKLTFEVLSDRKNKIAKKYGIVWKIPKSDREGFLGWLKKSTGKTLKDYNDSGKYDLPVPATFVINKEGKVIYVFKDVNYKNRADIDEIIAVLKRGES